MWAIRPARVQENIRNVKTQFKLQTAKSFMQETKEVISNKLVKGTV